MKKIVVFSVVALSVSALFAQGAGRKVYKPGQEAPQPHGEVRTANFDRTTGSVSNDVYDRSPSYSGGHLGMTPVALGIGAFGMPFGRDWAICGLRLNLGLPEWTAVYESVYGFDIGLSGETIRDTGGVAVNAFNNTTRDFYGIGVAGLWNRSIGRDSRALQIAGLFNAAEGLEGMQIGLVNRAHTLHGVQIGLVNIAVDGGGLQIGLWNDCGPGRAAPIIGIVY